MCSCKEIIDRRRFFEGNGFYFGIRSSTNDTYAWGTNNFGELGIGSASDHIIEPQLLVCPDESHWVNFVCGYSHVIGTTCLGNVYSWGSNQFGQLGLGTGQYKYNTPQLLRPPVDDAWQTFACGGEHNIAITSRGEMYAWGFNTFGELGIGTKQNYNSPTRVILPTKDPIKDIQCGVHHSVVLTESGKLYTCGSNSDGALGFGNADYTLQFRQVVPRKNDTVWEKLFCGTRTDHVIAIDSTGETYVWGWNFYGQLGLGDYKNKNTPHHLVSPDQSRWDIFYSTVPITIGKTQLGNVYVWGKNCSGMLGLGDRDNRNTPQLLLPINSDPWKDFFLLKLHVVATTHSGKVFQWGYFGDNFWGNHVDTSDFKFLPEIMHVPYIGLETPHKLEYTNEKMKNYPVHSSLVFLRCPNIQDVEISDHVMVCLLDLVHRKELSCSIDVLFEMYEFTKHHKLVDLENEIYEIFLRRMRKRQDLFQIIQVADQNKSEKLLGDSLAHIGSSLPKNQSMDDSEWENSIGNLQLSTRTIIRATKIRESSSDIPEIKHPDVKPISYYMKQILDKGVGSDFSITLHGKHFAVHRFVLAPKNVFFKTLFDSGFASQSLDLSETPLSIFALQNLLEYFYCGTVSHFDLVQCYEIMMVREYLCLHQDYQLVSVCERKIASGMTTQNCLDVLKRGITWDQPDMKRVALDFILANFQSIEKCYKKPPGWDDQVYNLFAKFY